MSQTKQQERGVAPAQAKAGRHWEWFWRIIAGLMLMVIAWVIWVLYQITPRSVVTPLAYESRIRPIGAQQASAGASPPPLSSPSAGQPGAPEGPAAPRASVPSAADLAMEQTQAAARTGAHQPSADVQAAALASVREQAHEEERLKPEGLKLSTEIGTPPVEKSRIPGKRQARPGAD